MASDQTHLSTLSLFRFMCAGSLETNVLEGVGNRILPARTPVLRKTHVVLNLQQE